MSYGAAQIKFDKKRQEARRLARETRTAVALCAYCEVPLIPKSLGAFPVYCSVRCRDNARNRRRDGEGHRRRHLWGNYRLTPEDYIALLERQGNRCAVCAREFTDTPHVDHDHSCCSSKKSCGKCIRGLLCSFCNTGLGMFADDPQLLAKAIDYLG